MQSRENCQNWRILTIANQMSYVPPRISSNNEDEMTKKKKKPETQEK